MAQTNYGLNSKDVSIMYRGVADRAFIRNFIARARNDARENSRQNNYMGKKQNLYKAKIIKRR